MIGEQNMAKIIKTIFLGLLLVISMILFCINVVSNVYEPGYVKWYQREVEMLNYAVIGLIVLVFYNYILKFINHTWVKCVSAIICSIVFVFVIIAENSFFSYLDTNCLFQWEYPTTYFDSLKYNVDFYFKHWRPNYHFALLGMLCLSSASMILHTRFGQRIIKSVKRNFQIATIVEE